MGKGTNQIATELEAKAIGGGAHKLLIQSVLQKLEQLR